MNDNNLKLLSDDLEKLKMMNKSLKQSFEICMKIQIDKSFTDGEFQKLDVLTSRFSRLSDIIMQKVLRSIDTINLEDTGTMRDRLNRAEKNELISSAEEFAEIRKLRNDIAHEYIPDEMNAIFKKVIEYSPLLDNSVTRVFKYCKEKFQIE